MTFCILAEVDWVERPPQERYVPADDLRPTLSVEHYGTHYANGSSSWIVCSCGWWSGCLGNEGWYGHDTAEDAAWRTWDRHSRYPYTIRPTCARPGCSRYRWVGSYCAQCRLGKRIGVE